MNEGLSSFVVTASLTCCEYASLLPRSPSPSPSLSPAGEGGLVVDAEAGEAFDSMLHRDARFWGEIAARKVCRGLRPMATAFVACDPIRAFD